MKRMISLGAITLTILLASCGSTKETTAQTKEASFFVDGVCGMCEERIENAAYIKGVKKAEWEKSSKTLTIVYSPDKTSPEQVQQSLAEAGHDNAGEKATDEAYDKKIHGCCKYREIESH